VRMARLRRSTIETGWALWTVPATLMVALAIGFLLIAESAPSRPNVETDAFDSIYYTALLSGRDPDASLRKAQFTTSILTKQFGMPRSKAAAEVAKFMIWRSGRLCGGG
jgi:hypothetical protein